MTTFSVPPAATTAPPRTAGAALRPRLMLAFSLWCLMAVPLGIMAITGPKFIEIFREFGVKLAGTQLTLLAIGQLVGSPIGIACLLTVVPLFCFALSTIALPPRTATDIRPRWPRVVVLLIGTFAVALLAVVVYWSGLAVTMMDVSSKLATTPTAQHGGAPAGAARPSEAPAPR
jgi:hypothetical protein